MFLKLMLLSVILVSLILLALGVKLLFDKNARFEVHSCALEGGKVDDSGTCSLCQMKDLADCPERKNN